MEKIIIRIGRAAQVLVTFFLLHSAAGGSQAQTSTPKPEGKKQEEKPRFFSGMDESDRLRLQEFFRPSAEADIAARTLFEKGDLDAAERACWRALEIAPRMHNGKPFTSSIEILGLIRIAQGRPAEAIKYFNQCYPDSSSEALLLGITLANCRIGDYQSALAHYEEAMRFTARSEWLTDKDPNRPGSRNLTQIEASVLLARAQRMFWSIADHGEADLRTAEKLRPNNPMITYELGKALRENKKYAEAITRFNKAARYGHGDLANEAKRHAESVDAWVRQQAKKAKLAPSTVSSPAGR